MDNPDNPAVWNNIALLVAGAEIPHEVIDVSEDRDNGAPPAPAPPAPPAPPARWRPQPVLNNVARVAPPPVFYDVVDLAHSSSDDEEEEESGRRRPMNGGTITPTCVWRW